MNLTDLPENLPAPIDDGAASYLTGMTMPAISFTATDHQNVNIKLLQGFTVIYIYPMTGRPGVPLPDNWDAIPGARGCTPQSCGFRDQHNEFGKFNVQILGLSSQKTNDQLEAKERLHLPFELLSDERLILKERLQLPTFIAAGMELYKRITLIVKDGVIVKVFYPIFPTGSNAEKVLSWFQSNT
tara:strand:+ start:117 stop:671 length:555 start_codon:yes stop_codon:yes gene_type:complete